MYRRSVSGDEPVPEVAALMQAFLDAVSFTAGDRPDLGRLRGLLVPGAQFVKATRAELEISGVEAFIAPRQALVDEGRLTAFSERETEAVTQRFGRVAHRLSTYAKDGTQDGVAFSGLGVISTQAVETPDGWRISAMAWDDERPGLTLADRAG